MPSSGNGIGTVHYGRSAEADDGSYVTTMWVVVFFLPIFPLRSERILPLSEFNNGGGQVRTRYLILARVPLDWPRIGMSYLAGWGILAWYISLIFLYEFAARIFGSRNGPWIVLGWFAFPFGFLFGWQKWFRPPPKLKAVEIMPGSEFSVYRKAVPPGEKEAGPEPKPTTSSDRGSC